MFSIYAMENAMAENGLQPLESQGNIPFFFDKIREASLREISA
jgi:hypothetical protein